jgi:Mg2+ and Co2+ transporter CorA
MYQSASWLHVNYGQSLNRSLMGKNPFYAIHEIFAFVASSENQFLNMLESKIVKELDPLSLVEQKSPTLSNLLYSQQALDRHIQRIRENIAFICRFVPTGEPNGPAYDDLEDEAATCGKEILHDYEYLLTRAMAISEKCNRGMQVVMNNASIEESRKAINQAEGVAILTRLAFVFMPLNYVSAVFGMNFSQFGQGPLSLWIWPAVSIPVLLISIVLVRTNVIDTFRRSFRSNGDLQN